MTRSNYLASHGSVAPLKYPGVQACVIDKSRIGELLSDIFWPRRVQLVHAECRVKLHLLPSFPSTVTGAAPAPCSLKEATVGGEGCTKPPHSDPQ